MNIEFGLRGHDLSEVSLDDMIEKAKYHGVKRLQLALRKTMGDIEWKNGLFSFGFADMIRNKLEAANLSVAVLSCYINLTSMSAAEEEQFIETLQFAKVIGAGMVATETGTILDGSCDTHSEQSYQRCKNNLQKLVNAAEKLGVTIGIEPVSIFTISSTKLLRRLMDDINSPNLSVVFDICNITTADNYKSQKQMIEEAFELILDKINCIHLKDYNVRDGYIVGSDPFEGLMDYEHYLKLIKTKKPYVDVILDGLPCAQYTSTVKKLNEIWNNI